MRFDPQSFLPWVRAAAPYIHALRGKTIVIAFGGEVVADETFLGIVHDLNLLHSLGTRLVVVHGARPQTSSAPSTRASLSPTTHVVTGSSAHPEHRERGSLSLRTNYDIVISGGNCELRSYIFVM